MYNKRTLNFKTDNENGMRRQIETLLFTWALYRAKGLDDDILLVHDFDELLLSARSGVKTLPAALESVLQDVPDAAPIYPDLLPHTSSLRMFSRLRKVQEATKVRLAPQFFVGPGDAAPGQGEERAGAGLWKTALANLCFLSFPRVVTWASISNSRLNY